MQTIRTLLLVVLTAVTLLSAAARPARAQDIPEIRWACSRSRRRGVRRRRYHRPDFGRDRPQDHKAAGSRFRGALRPKPRSADRRGLRHPDPRRPVRTGRARGALPSVALLTKMTVEFPLADGRVWPYLTGGGGTGSLRQTLTFRNLPLPLAEGAAAYDLPRPGDRYHRDRPGADDQCRARRASVERTRRRWSAICGCSTTPKGSTSRL